MSSLYVPRHIKRSRATGAEMEARAKALIEIVAMSAPCTVRQTFYQATVRGILEKSETSYGKVQRQLVDLRREGRIPFTSIADNTRWQRKPITYHSLTEAVERTAATYRRAVWSDLDLYAEVWLEKDALAGVLMPVTSRYDIPLMVSRGYASLSYLYEAASYMRALAKPVVILHFGDHDPSGRDAADKIEEDAARLRARRRDRVPSPRGDAGADRRSGGCRAGRPKRRTPGTRDVGLGRQRPVGRDRCQCAAEPARG